LQGKTSIADYMIIANGRSSRHVSAMASHLYNEIRPHVADFHIEGEDKGDWVLVDTGDVVIHLFRPEVRDFYKIEKLWTDPQSWMSSKNTSEIDEKTLTLS
jgi:ribosome-associated protein